MNHYYFFETSWKLMKILIVLLFSLPYSQSVIIDFLVYYGYIKDIFGEDGNNDYNGLSSKITYFVICIEMFFAAIAHKLSFPHQPYHINIPNYGNDRTWFNQLAPMWDFEDVRQDLSDHIGVVGSSLSRRFRGRTQYQLARGISETDRLMANGLDAGASVPYQGGGYNYSASDSDGSSIATAAGTNQYGALSSSDDRIAIGSSDELAPVHKNHRNDGISIKPNQTSRDYSPQYGVPKVLGNYFAQQQPRTTQQNTTQQSSASSSRYDQSTQSENTTSKTESGFDFSANEQVADRTGTMKKSDSTASDWLSTPTDDFLGIDVKGKGKDHTHFRRDPKT